MRRVRMGAGRHHERRRLGSAATVRDVVQIHTGDVAQGWGSSGNSHVVDLEGAEMGGDKAVELEHLGCEAPCKLHHNAACALPPTSLDDEETRWPDTKRCIGAVMLNRASSHCSSPGPVQVHSLSLLLKLYNIAAAGCHLARSHAIGRGCTTVPRASPSFVHHQSQPKLTGNVRRTSSFVCDVQRR
ncbi:hypothetical protein SVAN01_04799 [Stagonosporopsis vannaccii]|nr:hypothetical protein SVAN01_04799 [Stagonosporopsis vannaccii]